MSRKDDSVTITLMIKSLSFTKNINGEFSISWNRHGKNGSTTKKKIGKNNLIKYDVYFPMECNFKRKNNVWIEKTVSLVLFQGKKKMHKWTINLADLFNKDVITEDLKWEINSIGEVTLSIVYFLGTPEKLSTVPRVIEPNAIFKHKRYSITLMPVFQSEETFPSLIAQGRRTSLDNNMKSTQNLLPQTTMHYHTHNLNIRKSKNSLQLLSNSKFHFTSPQEKNAITERIDQLVKEMREEGPKYQNGLPYFGIKIMTLFNEQPSGTSLINPIEKVFNCVCNIAQLSIELSLYGFMSLSYLFLELKSAGIDFATIESKINEKIDWLFSDLIQKLLMQYRSDLLTDDIKGPNEKLRAVFAGIEGEDKFGDFLIGLIQYALFGSLPAKIAKKRVTEAQIDQMPFFDKNLMYVPDTEKHLVSPENLYKTVLQEIKEAPIPVR